MDAEPHEIKIVSISQISDAQLRFKQKNTKLLVVAIKKEGMSAAALRMMKTVKAA